MTRQCSICGAVGPAGEHVGEGAVVPCGGETFGGRLPAHGAACDKCADAARLAYLREVTDCAVAAERRRMRGDA